MIDDHGEVKVLDFGLAFLILDQQSTVTCIRSACFCSGCSRAVILFP
jgi:hypothetical protein